MLVVGRQDLAVNKLIRLRSGQSRRDKEKLIRLVENREKLIGVTLMIYMVYIPVLLGTGF